MIYEILSILIGVALVWIPILIFCPVVKITNNMPSHIQATNNPCRIKIRSDLYNWVGVLAQEYYESKLKHNPINLVRLLFKDESIEREMELMGHEITIQFLPDDEQHKARLRRANSLKEYYKVFKGWDVEVIYECMLEESPFAQEWIADNIEKITKLQRKHYEQK